MKLNSDFNGRIIQVTEALDIGDAVSNQVVLLHDTFTKQGFSSSIYSKWHHENTADLWNDIDHLEASDKDIIVFHFYGYSEFTMSPVLESYCTKVILYHNITPHGFFDKGSSLYDFCLKGRKQLESHLNDFHYFWADSSYNLSEMLELGASPSKSSIIPIIVPPPTNKTEITSAREPGTWLFLGRVAANKNQHALIEMFASVRASHPKLCNHLFLVGSYQIDDPYYQSLKTKISELGLVEYITVTGKICDTEKDSYFNRCSVYVSVSAHEGFGVPLVESPLRGLPVVALDTSAVSETMGKSQGVSATLREMQESIIRVLSDTTHWQNVLAEQVSNALRFSTESVGLEIRSALQKLIPVKNKFTNISIVICTYNRKDYLARLLDYLQYQTISAFEVVIVDGPSNDGTKEVLKCYADCVKVSHNPERNLSKSRNLGIELASGDIIAFIDDDAIPFDDWVENILKEYNSRPLSTAALGGPAYYAGTLKFQVEDIAFNSRAETIANVDSQKIGKEGWLRSSLGTNSTFTADSLRDINGFDEQYDYFLDESDLCFRIQRNKRLVGYSDQLHLRHEFAESANRKGKHNYNWFSICKNTAYFVSSYSGLSSKEAKSYVKKRTTEERILPLGKAFKIGEITKKEHDRLVKEIWRGVKQGFIDAKNHPYTRQLGVLNTSFQAFPIERSHLRVGHDIKKLHICILSKEFPPFSPGGGIGTLYYHLASELLLMGHEVTVIVPSESNRSYEQGPFRVLFVEHKQVVLPSLDDGFAHNLSWSINAVTAISSLHEAHSVDVVDSALWDCEALAFASLPAEQRPPLVLRLVTPFPVAMKVNEWDVQQEVSSLFIQAEKELISNADAVIPISKSIEETISTEHRIQPDSTWKRIPCGIAYWPFFDVNLGYSSFQEFENVPESALKSERLIVFVGRLERRKGIDIILQAANKFLTVDKNAQLLIAGRDVENWESKAKEIVLAHVIDRIHFLGEVADSTREKLFARAYCLLFPSRYESFGLVPLEAFVHGVPVIASNSGAISEVVEKNISGLLFDAGNADSLAQCISSLMKDPDLHQALSLGALNRVRKLSSRNSAIKTIELYSQIC